MDYPEFDPNQINAEVLGVSEERWSRYIEMMSDVGYIKGADINRYIDGSTHIDLSNVRITLKGLEYHHLQSNKALYAHNKSSYHYKTDDI